MWGAIAGAGLKAFPWVVGGVGAAGGVAQIMDMPSQTRRNLIEQGPDPVTKKYSVPFYMRPFVDEENTEGLNVARADYLANNNPQITTRVAKGVRTINPGETVSQYMAATQPEFDKITKKGRLQDHIDLETMLYNLPGARYERDQAAAQREFNNATIRWQNQESARQFDNNLAMLRQQQTDAIELKKESLGLGRLELQMNHL